MRFWILDFRFWIGGMLGLAILSAPLAAGAQQAGKSFLIGYLVAVTPEFVAPYRRGLEEGLRDLGYVEGRTVAFHRRYAKGKLERLPDLAAELVRLRGPSDSMMGEEAPVSGRRGFQDRRLGA